VRLEEHTPHSAMVGKWLNFRSQRGEAAPCRSSLPGQLKYLALGEWKNSGERRGLGVGGEVAQVSFLIWVWEIFLRRVWRQGGGKESPPITMPGRFLLSDLSVSHNNFFNCCDSLCHLH
jgi:hypothetical protein